MDLSKLKNKSDVGVDLVLLHPNTNEPTDVVITVASMDSAQYRKVTRDQQNKRLAKTGRLKLTSEEIDREALDVLVAVTLGWKQLEEKGVAVPCTPENVRRIYTEQPWIKEQVATFMQDRANYISD